MTPARATADRRLEHVRRYQADPRNAAKMAARQAVALAIKQGRLVRPGTCERCGTTFPPGTDHRAGIQFDHRFGYAVKNRLRGWWVCRACHGALESARGSYTRSAPRPCPAKPESVRRYLTKTKCGTCAKRLRRSERAQARRALCRPCHVAEDRAERKAS